MKSEYMHQISQVYPGSIAEELELAPGDKLLSINGQPIEDVLDYRFYIQNEFVTLVVEKPDKSQVEWEIEKDAFEDLGMQKVWIGYYEGNTKSKRVQEKCGFKYQWRSENVDVPLMHEKRTGHVSVMTKEDWKPSY